MFVFPWRLCDTIGKSILLVFIDSEREIWHLEGVAWLNQGVKPLSYVRTLRMIACHKMGFHLLCCNSTTAYVWFIYSRIFPLCTLSLRTAHPMSSTSNGPQWIASVATMQKAMQRLRQELKDLASKGSPLNICGNQHWPIQFSCSPVWSPNICCG